MLKLKTNDAVTFRVRQNSIEIIPFTSNISKYFGRVKPKESPEDFKKIREKFEEAVAGGLKK